MAVILADEIFKYFFLNENCCILSQISVKIVLNGPINNKLAPVMAYRNQFLAMMT